MNSGFSPILEELVRAVPGSIGAVFADAEGEVVEMHPRAPGESLREIEGATHELLVLGAQVGVIFALAQAAMGLFHFGAIETMVLGHTGIDIVIRGVTQGTYVIVASPAPAPLSRAMRAIERAAAELAIEMG